MGEVREGGEREGRGQRERLDRVGCCRGGLVLVKPAEVDSREFGAYDFMTSWTKTREERENKRRRGRVSLVFAL